MSDERTPLKTKQATKKKVMDLLAFRDYSEQELRTKLQGFEGVDEAITDAKAKNWLPDPQALAHRLADTLHRRNKGIEYINNYLSEKGLPSIEMDRAFELEKALVVVKNKYAEDYKFSREDQARVGRLLTSRGFDSETVRKVIYEKL